MHLAGLSGLISLVGILTCSKANPTRIPGFVIVGLQFKQLGLLIYY